LISETRLPENSRVAPTGGLPMDHPWVWGIPD